MWSSFRLLRSKTRRSLGIDITPVSIKFLQLSRINQQFCVEQWGIIPMPDGIMHGDLVQDTHSLADCLRRAFRQMKLTEQQAILSIPDACTFRKTIQVSEQLSLDDLEELVRIELDKYIPHAIDEVNFDFKIIGPSQDGLRDLLIIASSTENIHGRVDALRLAGLKTTCVDIESYAISRVIQYMLATKILVAYPLIVLLDIAHSFIKIFVFHEKKIIFIHQESYAEQSMLIVTIKRVLQFFYSSHPNHLMTQLILSGDLSFKFVKTLQEALSLTLLTVNPLSHMPLAKGLDESTLLSSSSELMTVCGLALRV